MSSEGKRNCRQSCGLASLAPLGATIWWAYRRRERWRRHDAVFYGLLSAGVLGNAADRLALGYVRDFLVTTLWLVWIFNLADIFIVLGFLLLLGSWAASRPARIILRQHAEAAASACLSVRRVCRRGR